MAKSSVRKPRTAPPSVTRRLTRVENLLVEMRHEQDVTLKHLTRLQAQLAVLTETATRESIRQGTPTRRPNPTSLKPTP